MRTYQVIVGNIGTVYTGTEEKNAVSIFQVYVHHSKQLSGRAAGEDVWILLRGEGEVYREYVGYNRQAIEIEERFKREDEQSAHQ
jgi:hypothetical protein